MPKFGTYLRWSDLHGEPVSLAEIRSGFAELNLESTLEVLCRLNSLFANPQHRASIEVQRYLLDGVIPADIAGRLRRYLLELLAEGETPPRAIMHRHQLLTAMRVTLESCHDEGGTVLDGPGPAARLFQLLLQLSDHLETLPSANADWDDLLPVLILLHRFNSYTDAGPAICRLLVMLEDLVDRERELRPREYVDLKRRFKRGTGLPVERYLALVLSLGAHFTHAAPSDQLEGRPRANVLDPSQFFSQAYVRPRAVKAILDDISLTVTAHRERVLADDQPTPSAGLVPLMDHPLVQFEDGNYRAVDGFLLMEKLVDGVYWRLHRLDMDDPRKVRTWWGRLFEAYVHELVGRHEPEAGYQYIPEPCGPDGTPICDGILVEGETAFVMEYKSGLLNIAARYSQSRDLLLRELGRKFVDRAGIRQLLTALEHLGTRRIQEHMQEAYDWDPGTARCAVPVLVCMESAMAAPYMIPFMNQKLTDRLGPDARSIPLEPLVTTTIGDLERALPLLPGRTLAGVLSPLELLTFGYQGGLGDFLERRFAEMPEDPGIVRKYESFSASATELLFPRFWIKRLWARILRSWDRLHGY